MKYGGDEHESLGQEFKCHANNAQLEFSGIKLNLAVLK